MECAQRNEGFPRHQSNLIKYFNLALSIRITYFNCLRVARAFTLTRETIKYPNVLQACKVVVAMYSLNQYLLDTMAELISTVVNDFITNLNSANTTNLS